jgi:hypothetical protein
LGTVIPVLMLLCLAAGDTSAGCPANAAGPAWIAKDLFGLDYERSISGWFSIDVLACTSGDIDFVGMRLMISRDEPVFQIRPSLGMCMIRGNDEMGGPEPHSPWFGFVWPGIGINQRIGPVSATFDISVVYGNTGEEDEAYGALSAAVMYMF